MPRLVFLQPEFASASCDLPQGRTTVGRHPSSNLVITDDSVSADHCEILVNWDEVILREHGSKNGTWVQGHRVSGQLPAYHGNILRFGRVEARLELPDLPTTETSDHTAHFSTRDLESANRPNTALHAVVDAGPRGNPPEDSTQTITLRTGSSRQGPASSSDLPLTATRLTPGLPTPPRRATSTVLLLLGTALLAGAAIAAALFLSR